MKCARHPDTETELRCGKCEQPICPKCVVQTPVGARCPECAAVKRLPVYEVSTIFYTRAIIVGLIAGAALGALWGILPIGRFYLIFIALGIGYAIGEAVSRAVNRKRGSGLQVIAGISMVVSYMVRALVDTGNTSFIDRLVDVYGLIALAIGILISISILRRN